MECFILRTEPTGENDLMVSALTRDGICREALLRSGRNIASRVRAGSLPFSVSDCMFAPGRHSWVLRNALPVFAFPAFRHTLSGLAAVSVNAACLSAAVREEYNPVLYSEATKIFRDLHTALVARESASLFLRRVCGSWITMLTLLGFAPLLDRCGRCGTKNELAALSAASGGLVCGPCVRELPDSRIISLAGIDALTSHKVPVERGDIRGLLIFLVSFMRWHIPDAAPLARWAAGVFSARGANIR